MEAAAESSNDGGVEDNVSLSRRRKHAGRGSRRRNLIGPRQTSEDTARAAAVSLGTQQPIETDEDMVTAEATFGDKTEMLAPHEMFESELMVSRGCHLKIKLTHIDELDDTISGTGIDSDEDMRSVRSSG